MPLSDEPMPSAEGELPEGAAPGMEFKDWYRILADRLNAGIANPENNCGCDNEPPPDAKVTLPSGNAQGLSRVPEDISCSSIAGSGPTKPNFVSLLAKTEEDAVGAKANDDEDEEVVPEASVDEIIERMAALDFKQKDVGDLSLIYPGDCKNRKFVVKRLVRLQEERVKVQKAWDSWLSELIRAREISKGYQALVKKVTTSFQLINRCIRDTMELTAKENKAECSEVLASAAKILDLEKTKIDYVAALHVEKIKRYQATLSQTTGGTGAGVEAELQRRQAQEQVVELQKKVDWQNDKIEDEVSELRYMVL